MRSVPASLRPLVLSWVVAMAAIPAGRPDTNAFFGIQIVDDATGRGVPLVELETVHHLRFVSDSAGWVAFNEPGLMGQEVFFFVRSHGYEFPKDGFGYAGTRLLARPGLRTQLRLQRVNLAERLYRVTGEGIYRDSVLLGEPAPLRAPLGAAKVVGQDSVSALPYAGRLFWFWGDTSRASYPLGHFWMAGAESALPGPGGLDPSGGVDLDYFVDDEGFSRPVARLGVERGLIWADAFLTLPDATGRERLVCHYAHMASLGRELGHGLAVFNQETREFELVQRLTPETRWCFPGQAHPFRSGSDDGRFFLLGEVFPTARVRARWEEVLDPARYEAWTCFREGPEGAASELDRDASGRLRFGWRSGGRPVDAGVEADLLARGAIRPDEAHYSPTDVDTGKRVRLHRGSVHWNPHRQRWVVIAVEKGGTSSLGEVWYGEALEPTGPWRKVKKIVTHERYSFYNPVHHAFLDEDGGRRIYFEGTYANTFSGNEFPTPRYDYNQIMYRLDLDDPRLATVR
ncbi:MAG: hypothetical protein H7A47_04080 [Verrucomicrobiales bacterium]|nr:hypothetical protein [Verrucomicrobiales bacterium]